MVSFRSVFLLSAVFAAASPVNNSNLADACYEDISQIDTGIRGLTELVRPYQGGLLSLLPLAPDAFGAGLGVANGVLHSSQLPNPLSLDDLLHLTQHVNKTLAVDNPIFFKLLVDKKDQFVQSGLQLPVQLILKIILALHLSFSDNVLNRAPLETPAAALSTAWADINLITNAIQVSINAYG